MAANCTARGGWGWRAAAKVGIAASFAVQAVDYSGEARAEGGDRVEVLVLVLVAGVEGGGAGAAARAEALILWSWPRCSGWNAERRR